MKTPFIFLVISIGLLTSCTSGGGGGEEPSYFEPVKEIIDDLTGNQPPDMKATIEQVKEVQQSLNQDPVYALTKEDQELLTSENLLDDKSELKGWVK